MEVSSSLAERKVIIELTGLLKKNEEKLLAGETKLCLTTSSLGILATNFRRYSERQVPDASEDDRNQGKKTTRKDEIDIKTWQENIRTMYDFVIRVKALKVIHSSQTMKAPIVISRFRSLTVLELKKVPIHMVEGLSKLRLQLQEITISKSIQTLKDLLETCGGDRTPGLVWSNLKTAYLSFNMLEALDQSLAYVPFIELIDLSHNSISQTGDFLMILTEIMRINLGYNMLKQVPQFSSSNKLRTLVLRNNSLENLEGLQALPALEELDISENFLIDHKVLKVLLDLRRLQVLCLIGNPLSYKTNHRQLTVQQISPQAGLGIFLLDGRRLSTDEIAILQQNQYRRIYPTETVVSENVGQDTVDHALIAVSLLSPLGKKKKGMGHRRTHSKERIPKIKDIEESIIPESASESLGVTPTSSYKEDSDFDSKRQEDEQYFKTLREHYGSDWLKALTANQKPADNSFESSLTKQKNRLSAHFDEKSDEEIAVQMPKKESSKHGMDVRDGASKGDNLKKVAKGDNLKTDDIKDSNKKNNDARDGATRRENLKIGEKEDLLPKSSDAKPYDQQQPVVEVQIHAEVYTTVTSPTSPEGVKIGETTDIYSLPKSGKQKQNVKKMKPTEFYSQESVDRPFTPMEESTEQYGEESEPFIVMLPDNDMRQLFVTVNRRFITEKDFKGNKLDSVDLKYLQSVRKTEEKCYGRDLIGGFLFTILTMNFDYVKKDKRQRRYAMESEQEAAKFEALISPHLPSRKSQDKMECLKCHHEFYTKQGNNGDLMKCPSCDSKMVIKAEKSPEHQFGRSLDITSTMEPSSDEETQKQFANKSLLRRRSPSRRSFRRPESWKDSSHGFDEVDCGVAPVADSSGDEGRVQVSEERQVSEQKRASLATAGLFGTSLKDLVDQMIPDEPVEDFSEDKPSVKDNVFTSSLNELSKSSTDIQDKPVIQSNTSWSDVHESGQFKPDPRESVSSVESDITVLATHSSRGSIVVISESSVEILTSSSTYLGQISSTTESSSDLSHVASSDGQLVSGVDSGKNGQVQLTPVGSPLSTSVCSSMVSSVYENTLAGSGEDIASKHVSLNVPETNKRFIEEDGQYLNTEDAEIAESVVLRRSKGRSANVKSHRDMTVYGESTSSSRSDGKSGGDSSGSDKSRSNEKSIYDNPDGALNDSIVSNSSKNAQDSHIPSIYDTAASSDQHDYSENDSSYSISHNASRSHDHSSANQSGSLRSHDSSTASQSGSVRSHDLSSANQAGSVHSSPLRRANRSSSRERSRSGSRNRSAICLDDSVYESADNHEGNDVPEFPSDLSPIKRSRSSKRSNNANRSALYVDREGEISVGSADKHSNENSSDSKGLNETNDSHASVKSSEASLLLPWEQDNSKSTESSKRDESLNHEEFVNIDHNIQLHLELHVFKAEEKAQCAIQCDVVQYMKMEPIKTLLVISTHRITFFRVEGDSTSPDWLKSYEDQPISELQYIDIGLGYQTLRLEFDTVCSSYTLLIADESRCKQFFTLISDIVQREALSEHSKLEGIVKSNPVTYQNLEEQVLTPSGEEEPQQLIRFLTVKYLPGDADGDFSTVTSFMSLVVTATDLVLVNENHQWPLPRLQGPLSEDMKGQQFNVVYREKINNIETCFYNEYKSTELRLTFFESSDVNQSNKAWMIAFETVKGVKSFVDAIREPWEKEFGVSLDITSTSFTDTESSVDVG